MLKSILRNSLLVMALLALVAVPASAADFDEARCERSSDLTKWRCNVTCASGDTGIATCPSLSEWGNCGRQAVVELCSATAETPAVACARKVVLVGDDVQALTDACNQSYAGFDEELQETLEVFPGLVARPTR